MNDQNYSTTPASAREAYDKGYLANPTRITARAALIDALQSDIDPTHGATLSLKRNGNFIHSGKKVQCSHLQQKELLVGLFFGEKIKFVLYEKVYTFFICDFPFRFQCEQSKQE